MPFKISFLKIHIVKHLEKSLANLNIDSTVSEKMILLSEMNILCEPKLNIYEEICCNIMELLRPYYPEGTLQIYGSTKSGFGTKGCDLDMLFEPSPVYDSSVISGECFSPTVQDVENNEDARKQLSSLNELNHLSFILNVLKQEKNIKNLVLIKAKCPIIRFFVQLPKKKKIQCDLSCHNRLVLYNTQLLKLFAECDNRVRPLIVTLCYWAKNLGIAGPKGFSSYAFSLLVIFFLQSITPAVLPPVTFLRKDTVPEIVYGWDVSFSRDLKRIPKSENLLSAEELLEKFFDFYWNFDFTNDVVCVSTGVATPIKSVKDMLKEKSAHFQVFGICIEDPFDLSHNVARNAEGDCISQFKPSLYIARGILLKQLHHGTSDDIFTLLFNSRVYQDIIVEYFFPCVPKLSQCCLIYQDFDIKSAIGDSKEYFYRSATQAVFDILSYIFFVECEVVDRAFNFSNVKQIDSPCSSKNERNSEDVLLSSIQCTVFCRMWCERKSVTSPCDSCEFSNKFINSEYAISKHLLDANPALNSPEPLFVFNCDCFRSKYLQMPYISVFLTPIVVSQEFYTAAGFLTRYIPQAVKSILLS